jgi:LytR cell envelope-related transcriptional attenuator
VSRGRHAAADGSFSRSAGTAVGRGIALLAIAVVLGLILLNRVDAPADDQLQAGDDDRTEETTTTTAAKSTTTTTALRAPKDVKVLTANGTSVKGAGGRVKDKLLATGYNALAATDTTSPAQGSSVLYAAGYEREAAAVAQVLGLAPNTVQAMTATAPVADLKGANVLVVVGPDLAAQNAPASTTSTTRAAGATTSTTKAPASTTTSTTR